MPSFERELVEGMNTSLARIKAAGRKRLIADGPADSPNDGPGHGMFVSSAVYGCGRSGWVGGFDLESACALAGSDDVDEYARLRYPLLPR